MGSGQTSRRTVPRRASQWDPALRQPESWLVPGGMALRSRIAGHSRETLGHWVLGQPMPRPKIARRDSDSSMQPLGQHPVQARRTARTKLAFELPSQRPAAAATSSFRGSLERIPVAAKTSGKGRAHLVAVAALAAPEKTPMQTCAAYQGSSHFHCYGRYQC